MHILERPHRGPLHSTQQRKQLTPAVLEGSLRSLYLGGQHTNPKAYGPSDSTLTDTGNKGRALGAATHSAPNPHGPGAIERAEMSHPPPRRVANPPSRRDGEHVVSPPRSARRGGVPSPAPPP